MKLLKCLLNVLINYLFHVNIIILYSGTVLHTYGRWLIAVRVLDLEDGVMAGVGPRRQLYTVDPG